MVELIHLGADPTLRNYKNKTPAECSKDPELLMEIVKKISDEFLAQDHGHQVKLAHERQGWSVTALNPKLDLTPS